MATTGERGKVIADRYLLQSPIAKGSMAEVWRAEHLGLRSPVAVKLIDPELLRYADAMDVEDLIARFEREAVAAAALRSPHIVQVHDHGTHEGVPYIVMELLEGEDLAARLDREGKLEPLEVCRIITHVARAVAKAHEAGIVHRDLKPANVFLVQNEDEQVAKVLDFGVAKLTGPRTLTGTTETHSSHLLGTPCYMSPEQAEGLPTVDWRSDLWSMAVMAYECLCGERPFESDGVGGVILKICTYPLPIPSKVAPVPARFDAWWARAASRNRDERFQSAKELAESLRTALEPGAKPDMFASLSDRFYASSLAASRTPALKRLHRPMTIAVVAGLIVIGAGTTAVVGARRSAEPTAPATAPSREASPAVSSAAVREATIPSASEAREPAPVADPTASGPSTPARPTPSTTARPPARRTTSTATTAPEPAPPPPPTPPARSDPEDRLGI